MAEKVTCDISGPASTPEIALENAAVRAKKMDKKTQWLVDKLKEVATKEGFGPHDIRTLAAEKIEELSECLGVATCKKK